MGSDMDATASKYLRGKYAVVGVGETGYVRGSGCTTRTLATRAVRAAIEDAGLTSADVDGVLSYSNNDSTFSTVVAGDLGIRLNFYMDVYGGGSSTQALIGIAIGVIEAVREKNMCREKKLPKCSARLLGDRRWNEKWWKYGINFGGASRHERQDRDPVGGKCIPDRIRQR